MNVEPQPLSGEQSREHYNALAERYTTLLNKRMWWFGAGGDRESRQVLFRYIRPYCGEHILELCCGPGNFTAVMGENCPGSRIVASDHSEKFVDIARRENTNPNVSFQVEDATRLSFADGTFDTAVLSLALHEMVPEDIHRVLLEMKRVTREEGAVVLIELHLPENPLARLVLENMLGAEERPTTYMLNEYGLPRHMSDAGIAVTDHYVICMSMVQIAIGRTGVQAEASFHRDITSIDPLHHVWLPWAHQVVTGIDWMARQIHR
jgi:ubiquinone/menaquinone biosynthesis C-methylase UbiE